jgi:hypothetical protein
MYLEIDLFLIRPWGLEKKGGCASAQLPRFDFQGVGGAPIPFCDALLA